MPRPQPTIPDLGPDNAVDLDKLAGADLLTYINYPGMADGDQFYPNWRGCGAQGEVVDIFDNLTTVDMNVVTPDGMPVSIGNGFLVLLDQGWVFYSHREYVPGAPDPHGDESLRRFFYVGKRPLAGSSLTVAQCKESHDLAIDGWQLPDDGATFVTVPYRAMSAGDKVVLTLERFFEVGVPHDPFILSHVVEEEEVGQPLAWKVPKTELQIIFDGFTEVRYSIEYAIPTTPTVSAVQTLWIIEPATPLLPALTIEGFAGNDLDPDAFPDGITLQIPLYPGIQVGDDVVFYASSDTRIIKSLRVDTSTVDSGVLEFHLDYPWLSQNNGQRLQLMYQYARAGASGTSIPLAVMLRKPLYLPAPRVEGATADGENRGYIEVRSLIAGVNIFVPDDAVIGAGDKVQMHWQGNGANGSAIVDPSATNPKKFQIKPESVPANIRRRVDVFYAVTPPGEGEVTSTIYDLEIKLTGSHWPTLQIEEPDIINQQLSLAKVPAGGAECLLAAWMFMAAGQRVRIRVTGRLPDGSESTLNLREGDQEVVTEDELYQGQVWSIIPRGFLESLKINSPLHVDVRTSFDLGNSYEVFPRLDLTLIA
ncbi:hypothetical protein EGJ27_24530 [Pseudomonas sp. v388]|uniref:hypothetical protein n=1 Tax=Pseudomonas sp. v388 TaxID=2479849 RepID=UPI000F7957EA|nr:hypothetical protein [Pseudomonas sp. v388]RRV03667.1 hypothetical protein EGJ27_24530 [Pseudomonas sp. v388]